LKNDPELIAFRKKAHLDEVCLECELLQNCGGSCVMSRITGDPYKKDVQMFSDKYDEFTSDANNKKTRSITDLFRAVEGNHVKTGHDYLRAKQGRKEDR
jgi:sulfatase maturation enzyme AslB (radical SAM superfamily)